MALDTPGHVSLVALVYVCIYGLTSEGRGQASPLRINRYPV